MRGRSSRLWLGGAEPLATKSQHSGRDPHAWHALHDRAAAQRVAGIDRRRLHVYGRRNSHLLASLCGLLLMVGPFLVSAPLPLVLAGIAVMALPFLLRG
jgi:hypothetical protein